MYLVISAQDIQSLTCALYRDGQMFQEVALEARPETYLQKLQEQLVDWDVDLTSLDGLMVVTGPGSFTATRVSLTIVNTIAFCLNLPIIGMENPDHLPLVQCIEKNAEQTEPSTYVIPVYDRPANITKSKKENQTKG